MLFQVSVHDSPDQAKKIQSYLEIPRSQAHAYAQQSIQIQNQKGYSYNQEWIDLSLNMAQAKSNKKSIAFDTVLPLPTPPLNHILPHIKIHNETTLIAAENAHQQGHKTLVLNFANGIKPGGGFLTGSRAQEESLCFVSTLFDTLVGDQMYQIHTHTPLAASSSHCILSTASVFMNQNYQFVKPWDMHVVTCAAPVNRPHRCPAEIAHQLLHARIHRIYQIAGAYGYTHLILGAWGCGAFGNDPYTVAKSFKTHLLQSFKGYFKEITFAISDWSPNRRFLNPFVHVFQS